MNLVLGIPGLSFNAGDATNIGLFGLGINVYGSNGLYLGTHLKLLTALSDDVGHTIDLTAGYHIQLNKDLSLPWLTSLAPQVGYRMGLRPIYYRDGFGLLSRTHGVVAGIAYDFYRNTDVGLVLRAHTLLDWAISSSWKKDYGPEFDDDRFRFGLDIGLSIGISHKP